MKITKRSEHENAHLPVTQSDPVSSLRSMHNMMDRLLSDRFMTPFGHLGLTDSFGSFSPKVDISETEKEVKVRAEVPGINPEDVSIEVTDDTLSITGTIEKSNEEKDENYYRMERSSGQFSREFMLPSKVDVDSVNAEAKNGVIVITLTKQPSEQKRKVKIKT
ncbi:Hsp20/alpha crystallin family protein [Candidatus Kaiserbacteria bacterium]|nr:Hsp20/alpha crystallin family protein [Candidatus Kaiserbacteria bacterium]